MTKKLFEGILYNDIDKTVFYDSENQYNIDTRENVEDSPFKDDFDFGLSNVEVWSIFVRKISIKYQNGQEVKDLDGNPLLYALKHEEGWTMNSYTEKKIWERIKSVCRKFVKIHHGPTIVVPSQNSLNMKIARVLKECDQNCILFDGILKKVSTDSVRKLIKTNKLNLHKLFPNYKTYEKEFANFQEDLQSMDDEYDKNIDNFDFTKEIEPCGLLRVHKIRNLDIRKSLDNVLEHNKDYVKMKDSFDGKDVIILDDSIAFGKTIINAVNIIREQYSPKSITVLTLFSRKQNYS